MWHLFFNPVTGGWPTLLAQQTQQVSTRQGVPLGILKWLGVIVAAAVVLVIVAMVLRRTLLSNDDQAGHSGGFTLATLRQMHAEGKMSDEEFETTKAAMLGRTAASQPTSETATPTSDHVQPPSPPPDDDPSSQEDDPLDRQ